MYNQQTREMATTRYRSLVRRAGRKAFVKDKGTHTKKECQKNPIFTNQKKKGWSIQSFQQNYSNISYEVIKATSIKKLAKNLNVTDKVHLLFIFVLLFNAAYDFCSKSVARPKCARTSYEFDSISLEKEQYWVYNPSLSTGRMPL